MGTVCLLAGVAVYTAGQTRVARDGGWRYIIQLTTFISSSIPLCSFFHSDRPEPRETDGIKKDLRIHNRTPGDDRYVYYYDNPPYLPRTISYPAPQTRHPSAHGKRKTLSMGEVGKVDAWIARRTPVSAQDRAHPHAAPGSARAGRTVCACAATAASPR